MNSFQNNLINRNPETGIAYGYISAGKLTSGVVDDLLFGSHAANHSYDEFVVDTAHNEGFDPLNTDPDQAREFLFECNQEDLLDHYEGYEEIISGEYEGVSYQASWMGGALCFFVFCSPNITQKGRKASPCVPNAAILDTLDGDVEGYDVPADWRYSECD